MNLYDVKLLVPLRVRVEAEDREAAIAKALELRGNAITQVLSCDGVPGYRLAPDSKNPIWVTYEIAPSP